jgi:TonB family protein
LTYNFSTRPDTFIAEPEDRVFTPVDPARRAARRNFAALLIAAFAFHAILLILLFFRDRAEPSLPVLQEEIPIEVVTEPPPPPPPPPPEEKKPEKVEKPEPEKPKIDYSEQPAQEAPRTANQETEKRLTTDKATSGPTQAKPVTGSEATPEPPAPARTAAPEPAEKTTSRETPEDKPDAEPLDKAAAEKAEVTQQKIKPTKERSKIPNDQKAAVARQLAALAPSPSYSFATASKVTPVDGGTEDMRYLTVVWGMILRQKHDPSSLRAKHIHGLVVVGFFLDETGRMVHEALYRTSGYPDIDAEAMAAVQRASPFPPPPPGTRPHLTATIEFKE